jgi:glycosyltransferase involved in cell wall biosynthesis
MNRGLAELGHDVHAIEKGKGTTSAFVAKCFAALVKTRPDHIVSTHVNFGPAAYLAKRMFGVPYTLVAHGIDIHPQLPERTTTSIRKADRLIAVSEWTRSRLLGLGGMYHEKIEILPNTFDDVRFTPAVRPAELAERYSILPNEKVIVTVARLDSKERYKGYDRIVEALPQVARDCGPVRFLIVGSGEDRERIASLARQHSVEHAVTFAGFVDSSELADHYRLADVFAMPSTGEGFGIVFLEAMGCGTPVVAGNRDGSVDALDGGRLGKLVDPLDVPAIAGAISSVLRGQGNPLWFDRDSLHDAATERFGPRAFVSALADAFSTRQLRDA